jgi:trans-aconitate methyltransferase
MVIGAINSLGVKNIADAGCGSAELIKKIRENIENANLAGFDVSERIISLNKEKYPDVYFFTANLNEDFSSDKKFEMVVCAEVIEHLRNWKKSVENLSNLVQKDGFVIITTQAGRIHNHHRALDHLRHFKKEEIEEELKKNGLKIVRSHYSGWPFMNLKNNLLSIFFKDIRTSSLLTAKKQGFANRLAFRIFRHLYNVSSKKRGPQIFILAKKDSPK